MPYTVKQISNLLDVGQETVRRWIRRGDLKATQRSKKDGNVISEDQLNEFLMSRPKYSQIKIKPSKVKVKVIIHGKSKRRNKIMMNVLNASDTTIISYDSSVATKRFITNNDLGKTLVFGGNNPTPSALLATLLRTATLKAARELAEYRKTHSPTEKDDDYHHYLEFGHQSYRMDGCGYKTIFFNVDITDVKDINKVNEFINSCANISSDEFKKYMSDTTKSEEYMLKMNFGINFGDQPDYDVFNPAAGQYEVIKYLVKCVLLDMRHAFMQNKGLRYISFENNKDPESIYIIAEKKYTDKNIVTLTIGA